MADNDSDYWKRREERMKAEGREARNKAIAAEKARTDKLATQREMGANEGKAAKKKELNKSWSQRTGEQKARNQQWQNNLAELSKADKKLTPKKNAVKEMLAKFKGKGGAGRAGALGGGLMNRRIK